MNYFRDALINGDPSAAEGTRPRPSSLHPQVVNVFFGDGHGQTISDTVDITVYVRLVSSRGERFGQAILGSSSF
jgi:prepilin-type processing-associated H-X9-DG protein